MEEGDEEFNEWSRKGARGQVEAGQPIAYVKIKHLEPARSRGHMIWGATQRITQNLLEMLGGE